MDTITTKIKQANLGDRNKFDEYVEEIPVRGASGKFFVVANETGGNNADACSSKRMSIQADSVGREFQILNSSGYKKQLAPLPPAVARQSGYLKAPFIISAEDEEEINGKVLNKFQNGDKENIKIREIERSKGNSGIDVNDIIRKREEVDKEVEEKAEEIRNLILNLKFKISNETRFKNILKTRIKGSRNNASLFEALTKKENEGGMDMNDKEADEIVKIASEVLDKRIKNYELRIKNAEEAKPASLASLESGTKQEGKEAEVLDKRIKNAEEAKPASLASLESGTKQEGKEAEVLDERIKNAEEAKIAPLTLFESGTKQEGKNRADQYRKFDNFYAINRVSSDSGKPKIEDIKYKSKLVGHIEEIGALRIKDFRHLSDDPIQAAEIIKNKIDILEEESFLNKIEGIKAWRTSEIYKTYLDMGKRAISERLEIGNSKLKNGADGLTEEEFYAIMELNKRLRF
ncbi:MAG: hypothetical protein V1891_05000 [bacterium]